MDRPTIQRLLTREGRIRPVWRLAVFFLAFFLLGASGSLAISALPRSPLQWGGLVVSTLAALLAGWIVLSRLDQRAPGALGFPFDRAAALQSLAGTAIGGALIALAVLLLFLSGSARFAPDSGSPRDYLIFLGWTILFFAIAAAFEEALFRGYPFQVLVEWIGVWPAVFVGSAVFALVHGQNPNVTPLAILNIFLAGVLLSVAYLRTLSLWFATGVHLGWNWVMAGVLDFPVSGLAFDTPLYSGVPDGPGIWTGGAFGPEAGIAGTIVLVAGTLWMMKSPRIRPTPETLKLRPLAEERLRGSHLI
jgi:membrane protease YdiL (CAAX protease family)